MEFRKINSYRLNSLQEDEQLIVNSGILTENFPPKLHRNLFWSFGRWWKFAHFMVRVLSLPSGCKVVSNAWDSGIQNLTLGMGDLQLSSVESIGSSKRETRRVYFRGNVSHFSWFTLGRFRLSRTFRTTSGSRGSTLNGRLRIASLRAVFICRTKRKIQWIFFSLNFLT